MTLFYSMIIFLVICLNTYDDYMSRLVSLPLYSSIELYSAHLIGHWVGGQRCVNMVFIQSLPAAASYIPGSVVDRGCDIPVESFVVHPPNIRLVERYCYDRLVLLLIFLSNVHNV